jgi:hypothetical protein
VTEQFNVAEEIEHLAFLIERIPGTRDWEMDSKIHHAIQAARELCRLAREHTKHRPEQIVEMAAEAQSRFSGCWFDDEDEKQDKLDTSTRALKGIAAHLPEWLAADSPGEPEAEPTSGEESLGLAIINGWLRLISIQPDGTAKYLDPNNQYHSLLYVASLEGYAWKSLVEELEELVNSTNVTEKDLQDFFEQNPQFLCGDTYETAKPHVILQRPDAGPLIPDFALKPYNQHALCDLLELKLPSAKLVVGQDNRRRLSSALLEACAQLREYRDYFELRQNREAVEEAYGLRFFRPNMMVVIGKRSDYLATDLQKAAGDVPQLSITTYDDLLARARSRIPRRA